MSSKGSKVTIYAEKLAAMDAAAQRALAKTAEFVHTQVVQAQVMPFRSSHLQNDSTFVDTTYLAEGHADLVSSTPYARRLYYHPEYNFYKEENPNAGGLWFKPWEEGGDKSGSVKTAFAAFFKREAGL